MGVATKVETGCVLVGEFVDEGEVPPGLVCHRGEPVRSTTVTEFVDHWTPGDPTKEFTVLMHDGRVLSVRGHALKHLPATNEGERDSYGVVVRSVNREDLVAVFRSSEINGIYHGEMRVDRTVA